MFVLPLLNRDKKHSDSLHEKSQTIDVINREDLLKDVYSTIGENLKVDLENNMDLKSIEMPE
jgi:hypothetical protein